MENSAPLAIAELNVVSEETRLAAAIRSALSIPKGRFAVRLALSKLSPPLPRPHHRRIAWVILDQVAQHHDGEAFQLTSGDMVAVCYGRKQHGADPSVHPAALPHTFARLFRQDVPPETQLVDLWNLDRDGAAVTAYLSGQRR